MKIHFAASLKIILCSAFLLSGLSGLAQAQRKSIAPIDKGNPLPELVSGYYFANPESRNLQDDDFENPGFLWMDVGEQLWSKKEGAAGKACVSCHQDAKTTMESAATSYPKYYPKTKKLITLEQRINICRKDNMKAKPFKWETNDLLALTIYVRNSARGKPVNVTIPEEAKAFFEAGKKFFYLRQGQLNISCAHCHEGHYGNKLRADLLSQGHINGFPSYRLGWQKVGSAQRRFKVCNKLLRAEPYGYGSDVYNNLELYLSWRGNGLPVETPSVRR